MTQGRRRKPTKLLKEEGSYRADRHAGRLDADMGGSLPVPPFPLTEDEVWAWDLVCHNIPVDVLSTVDSLALYGLATFYASWIKLKQKVASEPDNMQAYAMMIGAWKHVDKLGSKFGMTPADRAKIQFNSMVQITVANRDDEETEEEAFERGLDADLEAELAGDG